MGQVENDLPDGNNLAQDKAYESISYNVALFIGLAS